MQLFLYLFVALVCSVYALVNHYYAAVIPFLAGAFIAIVYSSNKRYKYLDKLIDANF